MDMENLLGSWATDFADEHGIDTEEACMVALREFFHENSRPYTNMNYVGPTDVVQAAHIRENSAMVCLRDIDPEDKEGTITFPSKALAVAWEMEILGQLSDGAWENSPIDWRYYRNLDVLYDESYSEVVLSGTHGRVETHPDFEETIMGSAGLAGRIKFYVRASGVDESYTADDLRDDLKLLDAVFTESDDCAESSESSGDSDFLIQP